MKKIVSLFTVFLLTLCLLTGCGAAAMDKAEASSPMLNSSASMGGEGGYYEDLADESGEISVGQSENPNLKIIYEAYVTLETLDYEASVDSISATVKAHGGYIQSSEQYGGYRYERDYYSSRSCSLVIRIPADNYADFLGSVGSAGNLVRKSEYTTDITASYLDVEARLNTLKAQETRLLQLLAEADSIETLLKIEDSLADVRYEIESYTSRMRAYDNQLSYSTVTLDLQEVRTITPTEERSFFQRVWDAIKDSAKGVVEFLDSAFIGLIYALPYLVMAGAVIFALVKFISRRRKAKAAKKAAAEPGENQE